MATVMKRRSIINPGKRRRNMSAKQIKFFGTAKQKAALKRRKSNYGTAAGRSFSYLTAKKLGRTVRRRKVSGRVAAGKRVKRRKNAGRFSARKSKKAIKKRTHYSPGYTASSFAAATKSISRKTKARRKSRRRKNVGQIFSIGLAGLAGNPGKRRGKRRTSKTMARKRRRNSGRKAYTKRRTRRTVAVTHRRRRRRSNTGVTSYRRRRHVGARRRRHSNPGVFSAGGGMLKNAMGIIGGAVATRYATQFVLQGKNTGWMGYVGNAVAALVLGWGAKKFLKSPQLGTMVTLGGFVGLAMRLLTDLTPVGQYVNLQLSGAGKGGDIGIGMISDSVFVVPTVFQNGSMTQAQIPTQYTQAMQIAAVAGKPGMSGYRRRRAA